MSHSLRCRHCDAVLKSPDPVRAGEKMKCPKCRETFTIKGDEATTAIAASPRSRRSTQYDDTAPYEDDTDDEARRKVASLRRSRFPGWLIVLLVVGPIVLLLAAAGIGVGIWLYFAANRPQALIVGAWEATEPVPGVVVEFHREGTLIVRQNGVQANARYRFLDDKLLELEVPNPAKQLNVMLPRFGRFNPPVPGPFNQAAPETVKTNATIVTLTRTELVIRINDVVQRFKRVA